MSLHDVCTCIDSLLSKGVAESVEAECGTGCDAGITMIGDPLE